MAFSPNKLKGKMVEKGLTAQKMASLLDISEDAMYMKLNCKSEFKRSEMEKICLLLGIPIESISEYFF